MSTQCQDSYKFESPILGDFKGAMAVCFSGHLNMVKFASPSNVDHLFGNEGYRVGHVDDEFELVDGEDNGPNEFGFMAEVYVKQPNGAGKLPLTITRNISGEPHYPLGKFKLIQTVPEDGINLRDREVTLVMTLENIAFDPPPGESSQLKGVSLVRFFSGSIDGNATQNRYAVTANSAFGWMPDGHGLMITDLAGGPTGRGGIWAPGGGVPDQPVVTGAYGGRIRYNFGTMNPGDSKRVRLQYRGF